MPEKADGDDVGSLAALIDVGFQKRLRRLGTPSRGGSGALHDESVIRLLVEAAADATEDDELAIRALQEAMRKKGLTEEGYLHPVMTNDE